MTAAASGEAGGTGTGPAPKPFLRRGSGWQARVEAAREGRRYVPRGGPIKDYSKDEELPARFRAPRVRAAAPSSRIPYSPAKAAALLAATPGASGSYARARSTASAAASPAKGQRQPAAGRPSGPATLPNRPAAHAQRPPNNRALAADPGPREAAPATNHWASKLLDACPAPAAAAPAQHQAQQGWHGRQSREEVALQEFEALESQVLREVGNSPRRAPCSGKKAPPSAARSSGGARGCPAAAAVPWPAVEQGTGNVVAEDEEDVFQSDGEGNVTCQAVPGWAEAEATAAGIARRLARRSVSFGAPPQAAASHQPHPSGYGGPEDEEAEMEAESSFVQELPALPSHPGLIQQQQLSSCRPAVFPDEASPDWHQHTQQWPFPGQQQRQRQAQPAPLASLPDCEASAVEQLQQEVVRLQEERARVARLKMELEEAASRMEAEQGAWENRKLEEAARCESERAEELRKLQRDRRVLEKQSRAILKMPTKQSKEEVAAVEALLAEERKAGRAREARHKLATERLRQQVLELQGRNAELREQIHHLEQQRLEQQAWAAGSSGSGSGSAQAAADPALAAGAQAAAEASTAGAVQPAAGRQRLPSVRVERGGRGSQAGAVGTTDGARPTASAGRATQAGRSLAPGQLVVPSTRAAAAPVARAEVQEDDEDEPLIADVALGEEEVIECFLDSAAGGAQQLMPASAGQLAGSPPSTLGPAGHADAQLLAPTAAPPAAGAAAAAAASVMGKASSALARFNHLRASLAQHEGVQQRLASRMSSLQASPLLPSQPGLPAAADAAAAACFVAAPAAMAAGGSDDDLRRLGRSLLASGSSAAGVSLAAEEPQPDSQGQQQKQPTAAPLPLPGAPDNAVVSEVQQADGRWERIYASGLREQHFGNGSIKQQLAGGGASLTRFANGDVKKVLPCGAVEYFYAEVASWQVTHTSGVDVFFFPSGQVEAHHPGGVKEILFPDGAVRKVLPDGRELPISAAHLSREIQQPQPVPQLAA